MSLPDLGSWSVLDLGLVLVLLFTGIAGWQRGLIHGVLSLCGFIVGGFFGVTFAQQILSAVGVPPQFRAFGSVTLVLAFASLGNVAAVRIAVALRSVMSFRPVRWLDNAGGATFNVVSVGLLFWLAASLMVSHSGFLSRQINGSLVLTGIDRMTPGPARQWTQRLQAWVDTSGLPRVIAGIGLVPAPPAAPPDPTLLQGTAVQVAANSVVRIEGEARGCEGRVVGSGFVFAGNRVMTNAHVVAGMDNPTVGVPGGRVLAAEVVSFDPQSDIAVLRVPDLNVRPLAFGEEPEEGEGAVVLGYPGGGDLTAKPATVRSLVRAAGTNIYGRGPVERDVVTLRGEVRRGNSGGPLIDQDGRVIGMVFAQALDDADLGFALALTEFLDDAQAGQRATTAVDVGLCTTAD